MKSKQQEYYLEKTIELQNATIRIHRPVGLTEEERERRMKTIMDATANLMKSVQE